MRAIFSTPHHNFLGCIAAFWIGIAMQSGAHTIRLPFVAAALAACLLAFGRRNLALVVCCSGVGFVYSYAWRESRKPFPHYGKNQSLSGTVAEPPEPHGDDVRIRLDVPGSGRVLITTAHFPQFAYGDRLTVRGTLEKPEAFDGFDYPRYLERYGIYATMRRPKIIVEDRAGPSLKKKLFDWRTAWQERVSRSMPEPEGSFLNGILLGSSSGLPTDVEENVRKSGTSHLVSASGANVTLVLEALMAVVPARRRWTRLTWTGAAGAFVCVVTGGSASVIRGAVAVFLSATVRAFGRKAWILPSILIAGTLLLLANPLLLTADVGFQLSAAAHAGILFLTPPIRRAFDRFSKIPDGLREACSVTFAATLATAPISLIQFGQFSLLGLIANPLVIGGIPLVTLLGYALIALSPLKPLAAALSVPLWLSLHAMLSIISRVASLPFGVIITAHAK